MNSIPPNLLTRVVSFLLLDTTRNHRYRDGGKDMSIFQLLTTSAEIILVSSQVLVLV